MAASDQDLTILEARLRQWFADRISEDERRLDEARLRLRESDDRLVQMIESRMRMTEVRR